MYKDDFKPFIVPEEIYFAAINYNTGEKENFSNSKSIIEAFKLRDIKKIKNNNLNINSKYDSMEISLAILLMEILETQIDKAEKALRNIRGYL